MPSSRSPFYTPNTASSRSRISPALLALNTSQGKVPHDIAFTSMQPTKRCSRRQTTSVRPNYKLTRTRHTVTNRMPEIWSQIPRDLSTLTFAKVFLWKNEEPRAEYWRFEMIVFLESEWFPYKLQRLKHCTHSCSLVKWITCSIIPKTCRNCQWQTS